MINRNSIAFLFLGNLCLVTTAFAITGEQSYTPTSFKIPIYSITLSNSKGTSSKALLYQCSGTTDTACAIDVAASSTAVAAAMAAGTSTTISAGTYDTISMYTCGQSGTTQSTSYSLQVQGTATIGSTPFYTATSAAGAVISGANYTGSANPLTTTQASQGYVTHTVGNCANTYPIAQPITVTSSSGPVTVSLYTTLTNVAMMSSGAASDTGVTGAMNCVVSGTTFHCVNLPSIVPFLGANSPIKERYQFWDVSSNAANTATGEIGLIFDSTGTTFLGGFTNVIASATSVSMSGGNLSGFATPIALLTATTGGGVCPSAAAGAAPCTMTGSGSTGTTAGGMTMTNFQRVANGATLSPSPTGTQRAPSIGSAGALALYGVRVQ